MVARIAGDTHWFDAVELAAETVLSSEFATPAMATLARCGLGLMAVERGDVASAKVQYEALETTQGVMLQYVCADRALGLLAQTLGRLDLAAAHFEAARTFCRKAGYRPELAWTCYDYAAMVVGTVPLRTARQKASGLLHEALFISTELGMCPLRERVVALRDKVQPQPTKPPRYPAGLTEREVDVLRLIAAGRSNPEIGEHLFISPHTVANHVRNILSKTGTANRVEAAAYAISGNLT